MAPHPNVVTIGDMMARLRGPCARLHIPGRRGDGWGAGYGIY